MRVPRLLAVQRRCCFHAVPGRDLRALGCGRAEIHDAQEEKHDGADDETGRANARGRLIEFIAASGGRARGRRACGEGRRSMAGLSYATKVVERPSRRLGSARQKECAGFVHRNWALAAMPRGPRSNSRRGRRMTYLAETARKYPHAAVPPETH